MKFCNNLVGLSIGIVSAASSLCIWNIHEVMAQDTFGSQVQSTANSNSELASCNRIVGAYLTTITDANGNFASRGLITLTKEGNFIVNDSNQGGVSGQFQPFTTAQGTWTCNGNNRFTATALDFSLSDQGGTGIGRIDYTARFDPKNKTLKGQIVFTLFNLQDNPLDGGGTNLGTTYFTGQLITPR